MRKVMFALAIAAMTITTASAQSSGAMSSFYAKAGNSGFGNHSGWYPPPKPLPPPTASQRAAVKRAIANRGRPIRCNCGGYIGY